MHDSAAKLKKIAEAGHASGNLMCAFAMNCFCAQFQKVTELSHVPIHFV